MCEAILGSGSTPAQIVVRPFKSGAFLPRWAPRESLVQSGWRELGCLYGKGAGAESSSPSSYTLRIATNGVQAP